MIVRVEIIPGIDDKDLFIRFIKAIVSEVLTFII